MRDFEVLFALRNLLARYIFFTSKLQLQLNLQDDTDLFILGKKKHEDNA